MFGLMPWRKKEEGAGGLATRTERPLSLFRALDEWFEEAMNRWPMLSENGWAIPYGLDMEETDKEVIVRADAPGFEPGEFEVKVAGDTLTITADHKTAAEGKAPMVERHLRRMVTLPATVEPEKVEAKYHHGVLELTLPRTQPITSKKIEVKAA